MCTAGIFNKTTWRAWSSDFVLRIVVTPTYSGRDYEHGSLYLTVLCCFVFILTPIAVLLISTAS